MMTHDRHSLPSGLFTDDEYDVLFEYIARSFAVCNGLRLIPAIHRVAEIEARRRRAGDLAGLYAFMLYHAEALVPPRAEEPTLHHAIEKLRAAVVLARACQRGLSLLQDHEKVRLIELAERHWPGMSGGAWPVQ